MAMPGTNHHGEGSIMSGTLGAPGKPASQPPHVMGEEWQDPQVRATVGGASAKWSY